MTKKFKSVEAFEVFLKEQGFEKDGKNFFSFGYIFALIKSGFFNIDLPDIHHLKDVTFDTCSVEETKDGKSLSFSVQVETQEAWHYLDNIMRSGLNGSRKKLEEKKKKNMDAEPTAKNIGPYRIVLEISKEKFLNRISKSEFAAFVKVDSIEEYTIAGIALTYIFYNQGKQSKSWDKLIDSKRTELENHLSNRLTADIKRLTDYRTKRLKEGNYYGFEFFQMGISKTVKVGAADRVLAMLQAKSESKRYTYNLTDTHIEALKDGDLAYCIQKIAKDFGYLDVNDFFKYLKNSTDRPFNLMNLDLSNKPDNENPNKMNKENNNLNPDNIKLDSATNIYNKF